MSTTPTPKTDAFREQFKHCGSFTEYRREAERFCGELEIARDQWKAVAERLAQWLTEIKNMPEYDQDDVHRLRHKATVALETFKQIKESK